MAGLKKISLILILILIAEAAQAASLSHDFESDTLGSAPVGWTVISTDNWEVYDSGGAPGYVAGEINDATGCTFRYDTSLDSDDYYVQSDIMWSGTPVNRNVGIMVRKDNTGTDDNYKLYLEQKNGNIQLIKDINGSDTTLTSVNQAFDKDVWYTFKLQVENTGSTNRFNAWVDGVQKITDFEDNSITRTFRYAGVGCNDSGDGSHNANWDAWSAADLAAETIDESEIHFKGGVRLKGGVRFK